MSELCNREYNNGGAHTARIIDGKACCVSCGHPFLEHGTPPEQPKDHTYDYFDEDDYRFGRGVHRKQKTEKEL